MEGSALGKDRKVASKGHYSMSIRGRGKPRQERKAVSKRLIVNNATERSGRLCCQEQFLLSSNRSPLEVLGKLQCSDRTQVNLFRERKGGGSSMTCLLTSIFRALAEKRTRNF